MYEREIKADEWRSGDEVYRISEMTDKHLLNAIRYLEELWPKYHQLVGELTSRRVGFRKNGRRAAPKRRK